MEQDWSQATAPDLAEIERLADLARAALPDAIARAAAEVVIRVADWPSDEMLEDLGLEAAWELTGLYEGVPLTEKSVLHQPEGPDVIWLFRRPILDEWTERGGIPLGELVTHVLIHEFAHHFGWSDADIAMVDRWWE